VEGRVIDYSNPNLSSVKNIFDGLGLLEKNYFFAFLFLHFNKKTTPNFKGRLSAQKLMPNFSFKKTT
jgi:hypothetical protein